ncbi:MAG: HRDC domain-containing protein [Gemmatimonadetes bacterium]|nr:HRDC domain-containing protein [Gemmatimonadota bacterium]MDA1103027.1 HRDC domain-containing protein [Gemmatimonadota bacterium]
MSHIHVQSLAEAGALKEDLATADRIALDCEAAGFHRYSDRLCLVQVSIEDRTYVVDPLSFDPSELLRPTIENPDVPVMMHGADFDLRLLSRDLGIRITGLVDTQISASLVGEKSLGLASLLETRLGVHVSKKYQRADWAERPLSEGMLDYAASDTRHLNALVNLLNAELDAMGRRAWAEEECRALETVADGPTEATEPDDPVLRVKGARDLSPRHVTALREALTWRDEVARSLDRAPFRVIGDPPLIEAVAQKPNRVEELMEIKSFPRGLARDQGHKLLQRLQAVADMPENELIGYPRGVRRGPGRPPPELEAMVDRLKHVRNRVADELGLPPGTLLANAVIIEIARAAPTDGAELLAIEGMRRWKAEVAGEALLRALHA